MQLNNKWIIKLFPLIVGILICLILTPLAMRGAWRGTFHTLLIISLGFGGILAGKYSGPKGITGIITFSIIIFVVYIIYCINNPEGTFVMGLFSLFFVAIFWSAWRIGAGLTKGKYFIDKNNIRDNTKILNK